MSIFIKDMDMPGSCITCRASRFNNNDVLTCDLLNHKKMLREDVVGCRYMNCPLTEEPYTEEEIQKMQELEEAQLQTAFELGKQDAQQWTPVNEESPKKSGNYWCTFSGTNLTGSDYYTTESDAKKLFDDSEEYTGWRSRNVIAWMPLPEPYQSEAERRIDDKR